MRCFVAAFLEADSARRLQGAYLNAFRSGSADGLPRRLRPVPPENYHVTLKFLGEIGRSALPAALSAVETLGGSATTGTVSGFGGLPRPAAARVVVATLAPQDVLTAWWARLEQVLGAEGRPFRPHVTVARLARPRALAPASVDPPLVLELAAPRLYRSEPAAPDTAPTVRYRPVSAADLNSGS